MWINESSHHRQTSALQRSIAASEKARKPSQDEVFGSIIVDHANLGDYSSGTHVVATIGAATNDKSIEVSPAAQALLTRQTAHESIGRVLDLSQTQGANIISNSWGSNSSSHYADAWATLQPGQPLQTDHGYVIRN